MVGMTNMALPGLLLTQGVGGGQAGLPSDADF
jgi:hypothetical protein